ncbi:MAG: AAA family ATPase [Candidatus Omnitrophica bacterium]|nr:AAA family ATPase [Candidatus Omnitrophota bacterium]MBU4345791.1 AAA family ATPase [Candidatus Omnitrophota bacterium]MBU4473450.1 AAA family ATPase [Candidatus Omnitrophota bacterium]
MYCQFYGLKDRPFNVTADPSFFFLSGKHKEALAHLLYGVTQRKGILVITGEIGAGKTTLCRFFLNQLGKDVKTAFILNPNFSEVQLLEAIIKDFGIHARDKTRFSFVWELNKFLLNESRHGNNIVLIIDEAQNIRPRALEQIRLLSNLETEKHKLIQIVLVGQPELNYRLDLYELRQLKQRIMVRYHITPLEENEVKDYINHRLNIAGSGTRIKFTDQALKAICAFSGGMPRLINIICDRALLAGFIKETGIIDSDIIEECLAELNPKFQKVEK